MDTILNTWISVIDVLRTYNEMKTENDDCLLVLQQIKKLMKRKEKKISRKDFTALLKKTLHTQTELTYRITHIHELLTSMNNTS